MWLWKWSVVMGLIMMMKCKYHGDDTLPEQINDDHGYNDERQSDDEYRRRLSFLDKIKTIY